MFSTFQGAGPNLCIAPIFQKSFGADYLCCHFRHSNVSNQRCKNSKHNISNHFCGISEHAKQIHRRQYAIEPQKANLSGSYQTFKQSYLDRNIALVLFQYVQKNPGPVSSVAQ